MSDNQIIEEDSHIGATIIVGLAMCVALIAVVMMFSNNGGGYRYGGNPYSGNTTSVEERHSDRVPGIPLSLDAALLCSFNVDDQTETITLDVDLINPSGHAVFSITPGDGAVVPNEEMEVTVEYINGRGQPSFATITVTPVQSCAPSGS